MNSISGRVLASRQSHIHLRTSLIPYLLFISALATATETVTIDVELQVIDLDSGTISDSLSITPTGADVKLAYNADRTPHAVVFPVGEGVEISFVAGVGFDGVTSSDVLSLTFSTEPSDLPFSANDCVVIRTDQGAVFKLGNATESGMSVTFNYELL